MKEAVRTWIDDVRRNADARRRNECRQCNKRPELGKRDDGSGTGVRAVHWCKRCGVPAFGSDSYVDMSKKDLEAVPWIGEPPTEPSQGELL